MKKAKALLGIFLMLFTVIGCNILWCIYINIDYYIWKKFKQPLPRNG